MLRARLIPCLLLHEGGLVKTKKFASPSYVGDPINAVKLFNDLFVDEIIVLDIDASKNCTGPNFELIEDIASESFVPFAYGGGVSTVEQAKRLFSLGVEKVVINAAAINDVKIISAISAEFGTQSVVASLDVVKGMLGGYKLFEHVRGKKANIELSTHIQELIGAGAGELFLNNVSRDGMMNGLDLELITEVVEKSTVPLIAAGGVGSLDDVKLAVEKTGVSAVAAGSLFVYHGPHRAVLINYPAYDKLLKIFGRE